MEKKQNTMSEQQQSQKYIGRKLKNIPSIALNPRDMNYCYFYIHTDGMTRVYVTIKRLKEDYGEYYIADLNTHSNCADIYVSENKQ